VTFLRKAGTYLYGVASQKTVTAVRNSNLNPNLYRPEKLKSPTKYISTRAALPFMHHTFAVMKVYWTTGGIVSTKIVNRTDNFQSAT
jgi:hypothetical protein